MKKKGKRIILLIILVILMLIIAYFAFDILKNNSKQEDTKIVATKIVEENKQKEITTYIIKIKDYNIESIIKEIIFETEEEAKLEYNKYETINKYEQRGIGLELKKEKLILTMPEKQFKYDIEYKEEYSTTVITQLGEQKEIINQEKVKELLLQQGYEIK